MVKSFEANYLSCFSHVLVEAKMMVFTKCLIRTSQQVMAFLGIQKDTIVTVLPLNQEKKKSSIKFVPTS